MHNENSSDGKARSGPENLGLFVSDVQPVSTGSKPAASPEDHMRRQAARLYTDGMTLAEVGEALGCSLPRARKLIQEAGVAIRRPGTGRKQKSKGLEKLPGITWLPADDDFMAKERRRMLRYMVREKGMGWAACRAALTVTDEVLEADLARLGIELEPERVEVQEAPEPKRRGRRLKDAEHLVEDLATMRSMQDQGVSLTDIAALFGLSVVTLKKRLAMTEAEVRAHVEA